MISWNILIIITQLILVLMGVNFYVSCVTYFFRDCKWAFSEFAFTIRFLNGITVLVILVLAMFGR